MSFVNNSIKKGMTIKVLGKVEKSRESYLLSKFF